MNFAVILLVCDGRGGGAEAQSVEFSSFADMGVKTLIQARNIYIQESRKDWSERAEYGDGSARDAVGKIETKKPYVGFAWEDDPAATVFVPENTPYYEYIKHLNVPGIVTEDDILDCLNENDKAEDLWQAVFYGE